MNARNGASVLRVLGLSFLLYLVWCLATWFFEGRVNLLQQPTPIGRATYVIVANILVGIVGVAWLLRSSLAHGFTTLDQLGFRSPRRTLVAVALADVVGVRPMLIVGTVFWVTGGLMHLLRPADPAPRLQAVEPPSEAIGEQVEAEDSHEEGPGGDER